MSERTGPPHTFGWLCIERNLDADVWEAPTGYLVVLDKGIWLKQDGAGYVMAIEPLAPPRSVFGAPDFRVSASD